MPQFAPNNISIINASTVLTDAGITPFREVSQQPRPRGAFFV
jgi:hypothetical protein